VVGLEVNTEKTKYMILSRHINAGQNHDLLIVNKYFETVANFKCIAKLSYIHEEIKSIQNKFVEYLLSLCSEHFVFPFPL
jgi:hypothetical protein